VAAISRELAVELARLSRRANEIAEEAHAIDEALGHIISDGWYNAAVKGLPIAEAEALFRAFSAEVDAEPDLAVADG